MSPPKKASGVDDEDQIWFLLKEDMMSPDYTQKPLSLSTIRSQGITLQRFLEVTGTEGSPSKFAFYMHSESMAAAVRLLTDEAIYATHHLYCLNDAIVLIIIRPLEEDSPNTSRAPSYQLSFAERRVTSGERKVPDVPLQKKGRQVSGGLDVASGQNLSEMEDEDKVIVLIEEDEYQTYSKDYLLGWISAQIEDNISLTEVTVQSYGLGGIMRKVRLTNQIWQTSLIRGPWRDPFLALWNKRIAVKSATEECISNLCQSVPDFSAKCEQFIRDLRSFGQDARAQARLEGTGDEFYLGLPYFSSPTRAEILGIPTMNGSVSDDLRMLSNKRIDSSICASHDLAPLFERILCIKWDKSKGKSFADHTKMSTPVIRSSSSFINLARKGSVFFRKALGKGSDLLVDKRQGSALSSNKSQRGEGLPKEEGREVSKHGVPRLNDSGTKRQTGGEPSGAKKVSEPRSGVTRGKENEEKGRKKK